MYLDLKLQLGPAYGDFLSSLPPNPSTSSIADKTTEKLVSEFRYLQSNATGSLSKFMEYLTYSYMVGVLELGFGMMSSLSFHRLTTLRFLSPVPSTSETLRTFSIDVILWVSSPNFLVRKSVPKLVFDHGWFYPIVLCIATNIEELYNSVLIETPLAQYFKGSLSHHDLDVGV
jgi:V-type H+-transporting ATPase subunit d